MKHNSDGLEGQKVGAVRWPTEMPREDGDELQLISLSSQAVHHRGLLMRCQHQQRSGAARAPEGNEHGLTIDRRSDLLTAGRPPQGA